MLERRKLLKAALLAGAGIAMPKLAGAAASPPIRVTRHRIPWSVGAPVRIAHLTDLHVGWTTPEPVLRAALRAIRRARPSLVALTGDYVNHSLKHTDRLADLVRELPKPCFATLGNHDHWSGSRGVTEALEAGGAIVLSNDSTTFSADGVDLPIVGVDDGRTDHDDVDRAFARIGTQARPLILSHFPPTADAIGERSDGLVLSGHTHGGQIHIPRVTAAIAGIAGYRYLAGWYTVGGAELYVSAGVGVSVEGLRGGRAAAPEVAIFELVPKTRLAKRVSEERTTS